MVLKKTLESPLDCKGVGYSPWDGKELDMTEEEQDDDLAFETIVPQQRLSLGPRP